MSAVHNRSGSGDCYIHLGPHNVTEVKDCEFFPVRFDDQPLKNRSSSIWEDRFWRPTNIVLRQSETAVVLSLLTFLCLCGFFRSRFNAERTISKYLTRPWGALWSQNLRSAQSSSIRSTWRRQNWCRLQLNLCRIQPWWLSLVIEFHTISWSSPQAPHTRALQPRQSASKNLKLVGNNTFCGVKLPRYLDSLIWSRHVYENKQVSDTCWRMCLCSFNLLMAPKITILQYVCGCSILLFLAQVFYKYRTNKTLMSMVVQTTRRWKLQILS